MIVPVILSGGSGTRLWPLSRKHRPKQFISLINDTSSFQDTILRLPKNMSNPLIICNEEHRFLAAEQLREINITQKDIILEPTGKNTAPAIALAALQMINNNYDPLLLILPADHIIKNKKAFHKSIEIAKTLAIKGNLVTFGITPNKAVTEYGYIKANINKQTEYYKIDSFTEKPNQKDADAYLKSGSYFWNSGMFMFRASLYLNEISKFEPKILECCEKSLQVQYKDKDLDFIRLNNDEFLKCPAISIDYAVMEKTDKAMVVSLDADWSDTGSWESVINSSSPDSKGNFLDGDVVLDKVENTFIYSENRLVSALGISDLIIVDTQDALLVTTKKYAQNIKDIIKKLKEHNRVELEYHRKVYRPWGSYDIIDTGIEFQVKRILVKAGSKLSLQKHLHRSEHWIVVSGVAKITCGEKTHILKENESTYIPKGEIHRLENCQNHTLEIIEIQTGKYLGEDDIIRLEDDYKRS